jgi:hypothetical protein
VTGLKLGPSIGWLYFLQPDDYFLGAKKQLHQKKKKLSDPTGLKASFIKYLFL